MKFVNTVAIMLSFALLSSPVFAHDVSNNDNMESIGVIGAEFVSTNNYDQLIDEELLAVQSIDELAKLTKDRFDAGNTIIPETTALENYSRLLEYNLMSNTASTLSETEFTVANNAGELINADSDVTDTNIWCVWAWDWYTA